MVDNGETEVADGEVARWPMAKGRWPMAKGRWPMAKWQMVEAG